MFPLAPGGESKKTSEKSETSRIKFHDEEYPDLFRTTRKPQPAGMPTFQLLNFLKQLFSLRRGFPILVEILQLYTVSEPCCPSGPLCEMLVSNTRLLPQQLSASAFILVPSFVTALFCQQHH